MRSRTRSEEHNHHTEEVPLQEIEQRSQHFEREARLEVERESGCSAFPGIRMLLGKYFVFE